MAFKFESEGEKLRDEMISGAEAVKCGLLMIAGSSVQGTRSETHKALDELVTCI